jgi:alanine dehydrogenase
MTLILSNNDVEKLLTMRDCVDVLDEAYIELDEGRGVGRPRSDCLTPAPEHNGHYSLKSMDGVIPKFGIGAIRINSDIVTMPKIGNNVRRVKKPAAEGGRYVGLVLLFSSNDGTPLAIMPDGVMQRMRVGAANGLGIKYLARKEASIIGLLGAGWQAGGQLMAACAVRDIKTVRCFSPSEARRVAFCTEWSEKLSIEVIPVDSPEAAMKGADIAMCSTNSLDPIFYEPWVEPGMHLSSIKPQEIEVPALKRAQKIVIHTRDTKPILAVSKELHEIEEMDSTLKSGAEPFDIKKFPTLPELVNGRAKGRESDDEVTCFLNNLGLGYQFAAAGSVVYRKAREAGIGHELPTDWFTEDVVP